MSKETKNQSVKLKKVVLNNVDAVVVGVKPAANNDVKPIDGRHSNPGRPVNKQSARYKRLAKQAFYTKINKLFVSGKPFTLGKDQLNDQQYTFSRSKGKYITGVGGCIISNIGGHVCNIDYVGRTKVLGYTFVLNKKVKVELNLKTLTFVSK